MDARTTTADDELPGNLPVEQSSFVGRAREIADLVELLGEARLVTLSGVGGVGKTRLALQVAAQVSTAFRHGTWLVELARVRDPTAVADAVASVFGVSRREGDSDTLAGFLRPRELLVVLDNCEHLLDPVVALVRELVSSCPQLVVLATSREGLGIAGERLVAVAPLGVPRSGDPDAVLHSDAARLFIDRAIGVKSDFALTDANAASIADVVQRLDGIPLALELAAARVPVLSPMQLAQRLDQRFRLLSGGERGAIERHATLRAAIDWSYDLLDRDQQRLLARISVFAGGCTLEAVESVCSGDGIDELDVLGLLAGLVARSLVVVHEAPGEQSRYRLLETIRQYAEEQNDAAESTDLRRRHARYYAHFVEATAIGLRGRDQLRWIQQGEPELENLRTAMGWTIANYEAVYAERLLVAAAEIERGPLAGALFRSAEDVLAMPSGSANPRYQFALMAGAMAALFRGSYDRAEQLCVQALAATDHDDEIEGRIAAVRATNARHSAVQHDVIDQQERAVRHIRLLDRPDLLVRALVVLGLLRFGQDTSAGREEVQEALTVARSTGNPGLISGALAGLAYVVGYDEPERSRALIAESLELNDSLGALVVDELALNLTTMAAAIVGEQSQVLTLSARALERGLTATSRLAACLRCVADALAAEAPDVAAVLDGHIDAIAPKLHEAEPHRTFRRRTLAAIDKALDTTRINQLRAHGASLGQTEAAAYALVAIARVRDDPRGRLLEAKRPTLQRHGTTWQITYRAETASVADSKGFRDLAVLLSRRGVDVHVLELAGSSVVSGASIEMADRTALAQYRRRLADLDVDRAEAESHHDTEPIARAQNEREALLNELRTVSGLGGKSRLTGAQAGERARKAVTGRIKYAIRSIDTAMPSLAAHLDQAIITGTWCRYRADLAEDWHIET